MNNTQSTPTNARHVSFAPDACTNTPTLPPFQVRTPECGACFGDLIYEDGRFTCYDCQITYSTCEDEPAEFLDENADPCGHECDNSWHKDDAIKPGRGFKCAPCALPEKHVNEHLHPCKPVDLGSPK